MKRLLILLFCLLTFDANAQQKAAAIPDYPFEQIAPNTWVIHGPLDRPNRENQGFMNNPGVVITDAGVVVIDPGSSLQAGEMVLRALKKITDKPVVAVFNTHIHGDHWLGNHAIANNYPDAVIYAHPNTIRAAREGEGKRWVELMNQLTDNAITGTEVVIASKESKNGDRLKIGSNTFTIHNFGVAHTNSDIMIQVSEESVVFLGDNVLFQRIPRTSDGKIKGNIDAIDEIMKLGAKRWVPGHGKTGTLGDVKNYKQYLETVYETARKAFNDDLDNSGVKPLLIKATNDYADWHGYEDQVGKHGIQAYMEVEASEF